MATTPTILGIDLGKNWFHLIGLDERGATVLRKKLNRGQSCALGFSWTLDCERVLAGECRDEEAR